MVFDAGVSVDEATLTKNANGELTLKQPTRLIRGDYEANTGDVTTSFNSGGFGNNFFLDRGDHSSNLPDQRNSNALKFNGNVNLSGGDSSYGESEGTCSFSVDVTDYDTVRMYVNLSVNESTSFTLEHTLKIDGNIVISSDTGGQTLVERDVSGKSGTVPIEFRIYSSDHNENNEYEVNFYWDDVQLLQGVFVYNESVSSKAGN